MLILHFSEIKMAVSAILNFNKYSTFDFDDIEGRVIPIFRDFQDGESISGVIFLDTVSHSRSNQRSKSNLLVQPLAFLSIRDACIY